MRLPQDKKFIPALIGFLLGAFVVGGAIAFKVQTVSQNLIESSGQLTDSYMQNPRGNSRVSADEAAKIAWQVGQLSDEEGRQYLLSMLREGQPIIGVQTASASDCENLLGGAHASFKFAAEAMKGGDDASADFYATEGVDMLIAYDVCL